jgi:glycosyltransferase involved in cell wall biosynthesis
MSCIIKVNILVLAPFFNHETTNRPSLVSEVLARFGNVDIVTTNFNHQTKDAKNQFQFNDGRTIYYLPAIPYQQNISPVRFLSHFIFSFRVWLFYLQRKNKYNVIYATLPFNLIALLVFLSSTRKLKILDVIDIWPDVLPFSEIVKKVFRPFFDVWKKSFALAVKHCNVLMTVSDQFMAESIPFFYSEASAAQRFYIGAKRLPRKMQSIDGFLTIVYIGNIGHLYDFETLLTAMQAYQNKVQFFLIGDGDRKEWLLGELKCTKIEHHYFGVVYDDNKLAEILSKCNIGFNGYRNTSAAFSYKANTYFAAGLPIINSMSGDLNNLVAKYGLGFNYTPCDVDSLKARIEDCLSADLAKLSCSVDSFFELELEQGIIKGKIEKFIRGLLLNYTKYGIGN